MMNGNLFRLIRIILLKSWYRNYSHLPFAPLLPLRRDSYSFFKRLSIYSWTSLPFVGWGAKIKENERDWGRKDYFFNDLSASSSDLIFDSASLFFFLSSSRTFAGALFTKRSLSSFFMTLIKNPLL
jgi:hypothetical protein